MKRIRRDLHQIPELGFEEYKTKEYILEFLKDKKMQIIEFSNTGVIAFANYNKNKTICLRAELDALPIKETNEVEYKSNNDNMMHACGHDGHMAILLSLIDDISKGIIIPKTNVLFLFQPSEERFGGSEEVIKLDLLNRFRVDEIYALHIWPNLPKGELFTRVELLAEPIEFDIEIKGKSSHVGSYKDGIDALYAGIELLHQIKKETKLIDDSIVHIGEVFANGQRNIVCDNFFARGTIRVFSSETKIAIFNIIENCMNKCKNNYNVEIYLNYNSKLFPLINAPNIVNRCLDYGVKILDKQYFQSEDFSLYLQKIKGVYFLLGGGDIPPLHSSNFNFDEEILYRGKELYIKILTNL